MRQASKTKKNISSSGAKLMVLTSRVTLRLRVSQIEAAKEIARKKDIPYQTLIRSWVAEAIREEQESRA